MQKQLLSILGRNCVGQALPDRENTTWKNEIRLITRQAEPDLRVTTTKAFTLIELLVVVLIIGILAAVALPQYQKAVDKSRYSNLMAITRAIADANEVYYLANGSYATTFDELSVDVPAKNISGRTANFDWGRCVLYYQKEVRCTNSVHLKNQYVIRYQNDNDSNFVDKNYCTALTTTRNSRFDKVCASVGTFWGQTTCELDGITSNDGNTCQLYKVSR